MSLRFVEDCNFDAHDSFEFRADHDLHGDLQWLHDVLYSMIRALTLRDHDNNSLVSVADDMLRVNEPNLIFISILNRLCTLRHGFIAQIITQATGLRGN